MDDNRCDAEAEQPQSIPSIQSATQTQRHVARQTTVNTRTTQNTKTRSTTDTGSTAGLLERLEFHRQSTESKNCQTWENLTGLKECRTKLTGNMQNPQDKREKKYKHQKNLLNILQAIELMKKKNSVFWNSP